MKYVAVIILLTFHTFLLVNSQLCMSLNDTNFEEIWQKYKQRHNKNYQRHIEQRRKETWLKNCEKIRAHNEKASSGGFSFTLASNPLADMTLGHYHNTMVKLLRSKGRDVADPEVVGNMHIDYSNIPKEIDWREKGFNTPPNNQKDCGSCYAFSIAHSIQAQIFKQTNVLEPLSEQQIVDCSLKSGNHGCGGGSLRNTLKYLEVTGGLMAAKDYPYNAKQTECKFQRNKVLVNVTSWAILPAKDESAMEAIVANVGPVAASINASPHTFQLYKTGVYDDLACSESVVNHAMLIVGYTKDAWILKNWWGRRWGEEGYMRLKKNRNQCGISNYVAYVIV